MKRIAIIVGVALLLCSCGTNSVARRTFNGDIYRVDRPWWDSRETYDPPEDCRDMLDLATYVFPEDMKTAPARNPEPCERNRPGHQATARGDETLAYVRATLSADDRDRLQDKLLALSNRECEKHHSAIVGTNTGANFGLATLTSLFSGGATAFAAASTKSALAGIATLLGATRAHFNENVYRQLFVGTILQAINDDRQSALLNIYDKRRYPVPDKVKDDPRLKGLAIEAIADDGAPAAKGAGEEINSEAEAQDVAPRLHYSIDEAVRDAENYHDRCSFYQGLVRVAVTVQEASPCVTARQRRDQILDEIAAIQVTNNANTFQSRLGSLQKELEKLETKVLSCIDAAQ